MKPETKVGLMFLVALIFAVGFAYVLGIFNPFSSTQNLTIAYDFAGGIDVGSPVRVMGIKVGKVKKVQFKPDLKIEGREDIKVLIDVEISKKSWSSVRSDSKYFINLAGVIGEKFIEITPGSPNGSPVEPGSIVIGEDPPRIDQLISQSFGLAGKVIEMLENNEGSIVETIDTINKLVVNLNGLLKQVQRVSNNKKASAFATDLVSMVNDMAFFTKNLRSEDSQKAFSVLNKLVLRLEKLDEKAIRKFLQEEGIKANMF